MATAQSVLPEDVLIATFHKVGKDVRLIDDERLSSVLNEAAREASGSPFVAFKWHPRYRYSRLLGDTLQNLDHAGSIVRENASQGYFKATPHTVGPFGESVYSSLDDAQRRAVDEVAERLRQVFGDR
jgi:hypothetical protein